VDPDPKLFAGSGSVIWGYGIRSGFDTGAAPYQKSSKNIFNLTFSLKSTLLNVLSWIELIELIWVKFSQIEPN
jgi:hypothetical protein